MQGGLAEGILPHLLRSLYVGRRTGLLDLQRDAVKHGLRFRRGHVVNGRSNVVGRRLGELMVQRGLVSAADLARATTTVIAERRRLGAVLVEMGLIDTARLGSAIQTHVRELLIDVSSWTRGSYSFVDEAEAEDELTLEVSTGDLILEAVRAVREPRVVRAALGDTERLLELASDPLLRFQKLTLTPADGFVLALIDGTTSASELLKTVSLSAEEAERSLLSLLSTGVIQFGSRRRAEAPADTPAPTPPVATTAAGVQRPGQPAAPATAALPADNAAAARRLEILETAAGLRERDHFQVLGLPRSAREADVKDAYFRLARRFHPDVHHSAELADLRDALESVFIRLGEAYEVLRDPRKRADYEERLGRSRPDRPPAPQPAGSRAGAATGPSATPPPPGAEPTAPGGPDLELAYRTALAHFEAERTWDAIQCLEPVAARDPGALGVAMRILLARCYLRNPNWSRRAEETLLAVTRAHPAAVEAWALLGSLYAGKSMKNRACSMYHKVLELRPGHEEAAAYLAAHATSEEPPPAQKEAPGGVLKRLFRRT